MLITSTLNSSSNGYSIVNKNYLEAVSRDNVRCAVADIPDVSAQSSYRITHNLGTQNVVLNAYDTTNIPISVGISYSVPDASTVVVSFDSLGEKKPTVHVVIMGALTNSTAQVSLVQQ